MTTYPECEKLKAVADTSQKIGEFVEWLHGQQMTVAVWVSRVPCEWSSWTTERHCQDGTLMEDGEELGICENCGGSGMIELGDSRLEPTGETIEKLLARYFGIDMAKVDDERNQMLAELRSA